MKKKTSARKRESDFITYSKTNLQQIHLVGGWTNPSEKYDRQIGSLPQIGMKMKNIWNHRLVTQFRETPKTGYPALRFTEQFLKPLPGDKWCFWDDVENIGPEMKARKNRI